MSVGKIYIILQLTIGTLSTRLPEHIERCSPSYLCNKLDEEGLSLPQSCTTTDCWRLHGYCIHTCNETYLVECMDCLQNSDCSLCYPICSSVCFDPTCEYSQSNRGCQPCAPGLYGQNCNNSCSMSCQGFCHIDTGYCQTCGPRRYGQECEQTCPELCDTCSSHNGSCLECLDGYSGRNCETICTDGFFGARCAQKCSDNCMNNKCHHVTGSCIDGCVPGFYGQSCTKACPSGSYGQDCVAECPVTCAVDNQCHHVNGSCLHGCSSGFHGDQCDILCSLGNYGRNCSITCSQYCFYGVCNRFSGHCQRCVTGREGIFCEHNTAVQHPGITDGDEPVSTDETILMFMAFFLVGVAMWVLMATCVYYKQKLIREEIMKTGNLPRGWASVVRRYPEYFSYPVPRRRSNTLWRISKRSKRMRLRQQNRRIRREYQRLKEGKDQRQFYDFKNTMYKIYMEDKIKEGGEETGDNIPEFRTQFMAGSNTLIGGGDSDYIMRAKNKIQMNKEILRGRKENKEEYSDVITEYSKRYVDVSEEDGDVQKMSKISGKDIQNKNDIKTLVDVNEILLEKAESENNDIKAIISDIEADTRSSTLLDLTACSATVLGEESFSHTAGADGRSSNIIPDISRSSDKVKEASRSSDKAKEASRSSDKAKEASRSSDKAKEASRSSQIAMGEIKNSVIAKEKSRSSDVAREQIRCSYQKQDESRSSHTFQEENISLELVEGGSRYLDIVKEEKIQTFDTAQTDNRSSDIAQIEEQRSSRTSLGELDTAGKLCKEKIIYTDFVQGEQDSLQIGQDEKWSSYTALDEIRSSSFNLSKTLDIQHTTVPSTACPSCGKQCLCSIKVCQGSTLTVASKEKVHSCLPEIGSEETKTSTQKQWAIEKPMIRLNKQSYTGSSLTNTKMDVENTREIKQNLDSGNLKLLRPTTKTKRLRHQKASRSRLTNTTREYSSDDVRQITSTTYHTEVDSSEATASLSNTSTVKTSKRKSVSSRTAGTANTESEADSSTALSSSVTSMTETKSEDPELPLHPQYNFQAALHRQAQSYLAKTDLQQMKAYANTKSYREGRDEQNLETNTSDRQNFFSKTYRNMVNAVNRILKPKEQEEERYLREDRAASTSSPLPHWPSSSQFLIYRLEAWRRWRDVQTATDIVDVEKGNTENAESSSAFEKAGMKRASTVESLTEASSPMTTTFCTTSKTKGEGGGSLTEPSESWISRSASYQRTSASVSSERTHDSTSAEVSESTSIHSSYNSSPEETISNSRPETVNTEDTWTDGDTLSAVTRSSVPYPHPYMSKYSLESTTRSKSELPYHDHKHSSEANLSRTDFPSKKLYAQTSRKAPFVFR